MFYKQRAFFFVLLSTGSLGKAFRSRGNNQVVTGRGASTGEIVDGKAIAAGRFKLNQLRV